MTLSRSSAFSGSTRPFLWALGSGLLLGPLWVGAAVVGFFIGRAGGSYRAAALGSLLGGVAITVFMVKAMVSSGCPSCVDALIVAPFTILVLVGTLGVGYAVGRAAGRRRERSSPAIAEMPTR